MGYLFVKYNRVTNILRLKELVEFGQAIYNLEELVERRLEMVL